MRAASRLVALLSAAVALTTGVVAVSTVTRTGRYLYNADGSRFYIKGVAYQPQGSVTASSSNPFGEPDSFTDPLADSTGCTRDLPFLQQLGVNVIRAYSVDSTLNHDSCMSALSGAGIYTIIDLSLPVNGSIDRASPAWSTNLLDQYINTIDAFSKYDNVLAYNVGNEVITAANATNAAAFIKAAARDTKAYLASKNSPALVGYAAIDADDDWLVPLANYLSCDPSGGNSGATSLDLFGLNNYEWCGNSQPSVYNDKNGAFAGYNAAAYFSEYGNVACPPRLWTEAAALFSSPMTDIWSGGVAFSYFPAQSAAGQFGMVTINSDNTVSVSDDFNNLKTQYGQISPPNSPSASGTTTFPACPTQNSTWLATTTLPPTPNDAVCACLQGTFACEFSPPTSNTSAIVGPLLDTACGLLGQSGGNCDAIAADGSTGTYGPLSFCDPSTKLSYVIDQYYEATNRNAQSCSFGGNATVQQSAPSNSAAVAAAQSSCVASGGSATFVPSAPSTTAGSGGSSQTSGASGSGGNSGGQNNGALGGFGEHAMVGVIVSALFSVFGGLLVFA
ncbi:glycoside hydrolase family 72 protein [Phanerochaete sordida]|uniref:1,3-beta-glucanosyltransferase n=1 Tax=Phanerochaete sordida TaxID=48140 RepID=A0A9P3G2B5_9APHY|nr:glycoside hydrolase family 72 protein [Phanerochaete sordida]